MQTIEASYEIVTPMFIGGGGASDLPELRPPSIKGALRFWWRALQWDACLSNNPDPQTALRSLHKQEADLFGAAVNEEGGGQGKLKIRLKLSEHKKQLRILTGNNIINQPSPGQAYLLGQGLYHFRDGFLKSAIAPNQGFKVMVKLPDDVDADSIIKTLLVFGLLGGLGSRSRRGWGSVAIRSLTHCFHDAQKQAQEKNLSVPTDEASYREWLNDLLGGTAKNLPPFTAFSQYTRIDLSAAGNSAESLLSKIGAEMQLYRSYGRDGGNGHRVNGIAAEQNFAKDHDVILEFAEKIAVSGHPERVMFGLPHNYFFSNGIKVDVQAIDTTTRENGRTEALLHRRASPLFIHIHKFPNGGCIAVQSLIQAEFLPATDRLYLENTTQNHRNKGKSIELAGTYNWKVITDYLDRFSSATPTGARIL